MATRWAHAAGDVRGIGAGEVGEADEGEIMVAPCALLGSGQIPAIAHAEGDVLRHRQPGEGGIGLRDHAAPPVRPADHLAGERDDAARGLVEPAGHAHQRRLSAAGRSEEDHELVALDGKAERLGNDVDLTEALQDPVEGDVRLHL